MCFFFFFVKTSRNPRIFRSSSQFNLFIRSKVRFIVKSLIGIRFFSFVIGIIRVLSIIRVIIVFIIRLSLSCSNIRLFLNKFFKFLRDIMNLEKNKINKWSSPFFKNLIYFREFKKKFSLIFSWFYLFLFFVRLSLSVFFILVRSLLKCLFISWLFISFFFLRFLRTSKSIKRRTWNSSTWPKICLWSEWNDKFVLLKNKKWNKFHFLQKKKKEKFYF